MKHLISIDPGTTTGIVVMSVERNPKLIEHDVWNLHKCNDGLDDIPSQIVQYIITPHLQWAAIEDQYLGKNPQSMKVLTRIGGRWQEAVEWACIEDIMWIPPRTWQTRILGAKWGSKRKQIDQMMKLVARQDTGVKLTADECAAWCIGRAAIGEILK